MNKAGLSSNNKRNRGSQKNYKVIEIRVTEFRVAAEFIMAFMLIVSALVSSVSAEINAGVRWSLFTLCTTTVSTLTQFRQEGKWLYANSFLFTFPIAFFVLVMIVLCASFVSPELIPLTENRLFIITVSATLAFRQVLHAKMLLDIYGDNKKELGIVGE